MWYSIHFKGNGRLGPLSPQKIMLPWPTKHSHIPLNRALLTAARKICFLPTHSKLGREHYCVIMQKSVWTGHFCDYTFFFWIRLNSKSSLGALLLTRKVFSCRQQSVPSCKCYNTWVNKSFNCRFSQGKSSVIKMADCWSQLLVTWKALYLTNMKRWPKTWLHLLFKSSTSKKEWVTCGFLYNKIWAFSKPSDSINLT